MVLAAIVICSGVNRLYAGLASSPLGFESWAIYHTPQEIAITDGRLYVSTNAFVSVDISDPHNPQELSHLRPLESGFPGALVSDGSYAYVAWKGGIRVLDVVNNSASNIISQNFTELGYGYKDMMLDYPYLYALGSNKGQLNGLVIADVGNPAELTLVCNFDITDQLGGDGWPWKLHRRGDYIYFTSGPVKDGHARLHTVDISEPNNPQFACEPLELGWAWNGGSKPTPWTRSHLSIAGRGDRLYVTGRFKQPLCYDIAIIDVTNPAAPVISSRWDAWPGEDRDISDISITHSRACVTGRDNALFVLDISTPDSPQICGKADIPDGYDGRDYRVQIHGDYAYAHMYDTHAVYIIDISDDNSPEVLNEIPFGHDLTDVSSAGDYLYASIWDWKQLYTVDIREPDTPKVVNRKVVLGNGWAVDVRGNYAYEAMGHGWGNGLGGLAIFDLSAPDTPVEIGRCPSVIWQHEVHAHIDIERKLAYMAIGAPFCINYTENWHEYDSNSPGMRIIDISDPCKPAELGSLYFHDPNHQSQTIFQSGDYAYVAARAGGLYIINVTDPCNPQLACRWQPDITEQTYARSVFVEGNHAYVAYGNTLSILDVSNPSEPSLIYGAFDTAGQQCHDVAVSGDWAYLITANALRRFYVADPTNPQQTASVEDIFCTPPARLDLCYPYVHVACHNGGVYTFWAAAGDFFAPFGVVDLADFGILAAAWQSVAGDANWNPLCNLAAPDDVIDIADLAVFCENWLVGTE